MKRTTILVLIAIFVCAGAPRTSVAQTAKEIVQKAIDAHGGLDNLKKYPGTKSVMKGKMFFMNNEVPIEGESTYFLPDLGKNVMKMEFGGQKIAVEQVMNGGKVKMVGNGKSLPVSDALKKELTEGVYAQGIAHLYPLIEDKAFDLSVIDKPEKVGGKETVGILVKSKGHKDLKIFFDAQTFVEVMAERKGLDIAEQEVTQRMLILETKKYDGILRAVKCEVLNDGQKFMTFELTDIKHFEKADKKEFDVSD